MAVFGAMFSYIAAGGLASSCCGRTSRTSSGPIVSPLGIPGAVVTIVIARGDALYQLQDPNFLKGVIWVIVWFAVGIVYFALVGRHKLILRRRKSSRWRIETK